MMTFVLAFLLQCFLPIFDVKSQEFLGLSLLNTDVQQREFTVTSRSPEGTAVQTGRLTLPGGGQRAGLLREILDVSSSPASGWVRIDGQGSSCGAYLLQGSDESFAGFEPASAPLASEVLLPHVEVNTGFMELNHIETAVAVVNPNTAAATVNVRLFTLSGVLRGTTMIHVPAQGSRVFHVDEVFGSALPGNGVGAKRFKAIFG